MRGLTIAVALLLSSTFSPNAEAQGDPSGVISAIRRQPPAPPEPTPRLNDGTVNLGRSRGEKGVWGLPVIANFAQVAAGAPAGFRGNLRSGAAAEPHIPFQPWAAAVYNYNSMNLSKFDPEGYCLPPGGPRLMATPFPMEVIQLPEEDRIVMIYEGGTHIWREIYMDGRPHPKGDDLNPTYLGHSVGRWEGDTLVVDVVGFNEQTWMDYFGHPHTDQLHVVEKFSRPTKNVLRYEATMDDPGAYTKPFTIRWTIPWTASGELTEYICQENNKYLQSLTDDFGQLLFGKK